MRHGKCLECFFLELGLLADGLERAGLAAIDFGNVAAEFASELVAVGEDGELLDRLLGQDELECLEHPAHDDGNVDEELAAERLRVDLGEELDGALGRSLDIGVLADEGDAQIVVDLDALVRIRAIAVVRNRLRSVGKVELLDAQLHKSDAPAEEPVSGGKVSRI